MKSLLNKSKWIYYTLGIISGLIILSTLFFMNQYKYVRINYNTTTKVNSSGVEEEVTTYDKFATLNGFQQTYLFSFVNNLATNQYSDSEAVLYSDYYQIEKNDVNEAKFDELKVKALIFTLNEDEYSPISSSAKYEDYKDVDLYSKKAIDSNYQYEAVKILDENDVIKTILSKDENGNYKYIEKGSGLDATYRFTNDVFTNLKNFRKSLDDFNLTILIYGIVSLICFALLIVLSNHNRKIYYKANLIGGVLLPMVNVVFVIILIINAISLLSSINNAGNNAVYNVVSALQNAKIAAKNYRVADTDAVNYTYLQNITKCFTVNGATLIGYIVFFGLTAAYNVFLIIFAFLKYKDTEKQRNETLEKARLVGEKA